jgi:hypothetical protein
MACYDIKAQQLLDVCRENGVAVPEEIAVIGVDNDPLLCSLTTPPLTSVIPNTHRTGYEAAQLLDRMMGGEKIAAKGHLIPPIGIETRQSTDVLALADREIAAAVRFIREHACDGRHDQRPAARRAALAPRDGEPLPQATGARPTRTSSGSASTASSSSSPRPTIRWSGSPPSRASIIRST